MPHAYPAIRREPKASIIGAAMRQLIPHFLKRDVNCLMVSACPADNAAHDGYREKAEGVRRSPRSYQFGKKIKAPQFQSGGARGGVLHRAPCRHHDLLGKLVGPPF